MPPQCQRVCSPDTGKPISSAVLMEAAVGDRLPNGQNWPKNGGGEGLF